MCHHFIKTDTKFNYVILMHPMEFKKVKNNTGMFVHRQLKNSDLIIDVDFTQNKKVNEYIKTDQCFVLYPGTSAINLSREKLSLSENQNKTIFIIDATWPCAKKMLKLSKNLQDLPQISFEHNMRSGYAFKKQPHEKCLSTIESVHYLINLLAEQNIENSVSDNFLQAFKAMNVYQLQCIEDPNNNHHFHD